MTGGSGRVGDAAPKATAELHRDETRDDYTRMVSTLKERYPADDMRCLYHQSGLSCQHSYRTHTAAHTDEDCPFRHGSAVALEFLPCR